MSAKLYSKEFKIEAVEQTGLKVQGWIQKASPRTDNPKLTK